MSAIDNYQDCPYTQTVRTVEESDVQVDQESARSRPEDGNSSGATAPLLLVKDGRNGTWDRKQKRAYFRFMTAVGLWSFEGKQILRVDLTSSPESNAARLAVHGKELRRRVMREFGLDRIEYVQVQTKEGYGVLHGMWAMTVKRNKAKAVWIPVEWLSAQWKDIHGAYRVWIRRTKNFRDQKSASKYICTQYLVDQEGMGFKRMSFSYGRSYPRMDAVYKFLKNEYETKNQIRLAQGWNPLLRSILYGWWGSYLKGERLEFSRWTVQLYSGIESR